MAAAIAFALAVLAVEHILKPEPQIDVATAERMRQREEYLRQEMDQLLREMEWRRSAEETALLSAMQHCLLLGIALVLVLLAVASWLIRRRKLAFENRSEQDSSSRKEENNEEVKDLNGAHNGVRSLAVSTPLLMQVLPDTCKALQHLVADLLGVCRMLSKKTRCHRCTQPLGWTVSVNPGESTRTASPTACSCSCGHPPDTLSAWSWTPWGSCHQGTPASAWHWTACARASSCWRIVCASSTAPTTTCRGIRARTSYIPSARALA